MTSHERTCPAIVDHPAASDRDTDPAPAAACGLFDAVLAATPPAVSQDVELLLVAAADRTGLRARIARLLGVVPGLSPAGLTGLAADLDAAPLDEPVRAAVVAGSPSDALVRLTALRDRLAAGADRVFAPEIGVFAGRAHSRPRIAYLFPGSGGAGGPAAALCRRFPVAAAACLLADGPAGVDRVPTEVAHGRVVAGSLAALRVLRLLGVEARIAVGHSLGELTALAWAGALDDARLMRLAHARGRIMATAGRGAGGMAGLAADVPTTHRLINGVGAVIAGYHAPRETVVSGPAAAMDQVCARAAAEGIGAVRINVPHAFHSPLVRPAADGMAERVAGVTFGPVSRSVVSTVTGEVVEPGTDLRALLRDQVLHPVRFGQAAATAVAGADLAVEVGPGRVLTRLVGQIAPGTPALSADTGDESLSALLSVVGAAHVAGARVDPGALFAGRPVPQPRAATRRTDHDTGTTNSGAVVAVLSGEEY